MWPALVAPEQNVKLSHTKPEDVANSPRCRLPPAAGGKAQRVGASDFARGHASLVRYAPYVMLSLYS